MAVLLMSKQEFNRLDVLLRVQSRQLRVADACGLMGCIGDRFFVCCVASSRMALQACCRGGAGSRAIIGFRPKFRRWRYP
jgi:hypothetical protein